MIITNCNKNTISTCGCTPSFSSYVNNSVSVLDVGNLLGGSCTLTAYVIDWYRDGVHSLVSGTIGSAPDVTAFHPFTGSGAIPVAGGNWVPVIRWVVVGGVKIYSTPTPCKTWCSTLTGLPSITVNSLNCSTTNSTGDSNYQYKLSYNTTQDYSLADRTVRWDLDASIKWFAVRFEGLTVADKIEVFKNEETNPLTAWIVGSNLNTSQVATMPYNSGSASEIKFVQEISTYNSGDYLKIKITPSVLESNTNTIWNSYFKCLSSSVDFYTECNAFSHDMQIIDVSTIYMQKDPSNCRWICYGTLRSPGLVMSGSNMFKYGGWFTGGSGYTTEYATTGKVGVTLTYGTFANSQFAFNGSTTCTNMDSSIIMSHSGNNFNFSFTDVSIYSYYKSRYQSMMSSSYYTGWNPSDASIEFYRYSVLTWKKAATCGDAGVTNSLYFHINSSVNFFDASVAFTIAIANPSNNFVCEPTCDTRCQTINSRISLVNSTINLSSIYDGAASVRPLEPFYATKLSTGVSNTTQAFGMLYYSAPDKVLPCYPDYSCMDVSPSIYKSFFLYKWLVKITNYADPSNNFEVWDGIESSTGCQTGNSSTTYILKYKKLAGVQTFP